MKQNSICESELILNADGSIYHLHLLPEDLADTVIFVGDPDRVPKVSRHFDRIELEKSNREFVTHTGYIDSKRLSVISTGIGCENIDIVFNEVDALANINFTERTRKINKKKLDIIRLGTCGALQADTPIDSIVISYLAFGLSNLMGFYQREHSDAENFALEQFKQHYPEFFNKVKMFVATGNHDIVQHMSSIGTIGHTVTCTGFYGPQGRELNGRVAFPDFFDKIADFELEQTHVKNFEMETAAIYGLGNMFGHRCCSISTVVAQRATGHFSTDMEKAVNTMVTQALEKMMDLKP